MDKNIMEIQSTIKLTWILNDKIEIKLILKEINVAVINKNNAKIKIIRENIKIISIWKLILLFLIPQINVLIN